MAFTQVVTLALLGSMALAAPAPQYLTSLGNGIPFGSLRAVDFQNGQGQFIQQLRAVPVNAQLFSQGNQAQIVRAVSATNEAAPATATVIRARQPIQETLIQEEEIEVVPQDASYNFGYSVSDAVSGDAKTRQESREGDVVRGSYSVADPDGRIRVVEYTADKEHGFQARVTYDGEEGPPAIPVDTPAVTQTSADSVVIAARANTLNAANNVQVVRNSVVHSVPNVARAQIFNNGNNDHFIHQVSGGNQVLVRSNNDHFAHVSQPVVLRNNAQHVLHNAPVSVSHQSPRFIQIQGGQFDGLRAFQLV
eukprot:maker-scaffold434_size172279-snap-gene-0.21 protein:Tk10098 transcript:maker-scaffold434_size172279-snap-gene-0.21-mRNA-1 annotation:"cuticular protein 67bd"